MEVRNKKRRIKTPLFEKREPLTYESRLEIVLERKRRMEESRRDEKMHLMEARLLNARNNKKAQ